MNKITKILIALIGLPAALLSASLTISGLMGLNAIGLVFGAATYIYVDYVIRIFKE